MAGRRRRALRGGCTCDASYEIEFWQEVLDFWADSEDDDDEGDEGEEGVACPPQIDTGGGPGPGLAGKAEEEIVSDPKLLGRFGEELAVRYLRSRGWTILERNYRCPFGEADVVGDDGEQVAMVEVKTRRGVEVYPEEMVTADKMDRYRSICFHYMGEHPEAGTPRFDVIGINVVGPGVSTVRHLAGINLRDE